MKSIEDLEIKTELIEAKVAIELEHKYGAQNYHPLPVVLSRGSGVFLWDTAGGRYYDFLSAYSAVNQGHCHPKILEAMIEQAGRLTLTSRAFYNDKLGVCEQFLATTFGFDKVLMMNSGAEANETAIKLARLWGYKIKGIEPDKSIILTAKNNFHGRTLAMISASNDAQARAGYGPFLDGYQMVDFNDTNALERAISNPNVAAFWFEPIQGEAGIIIPDDGYLSRVRALCSAHNVLMMADEVQTAIGRTGYLYACQHEQIRPDVLILGKALSAGMLPISAVLADAPLMDLFVPGSHGSTFGGNPLACVVAMASINVLIEENMCQNAVEMGEILQNGLNELSHKYPHIISKVRGRGLMLAIVIEPQQSGKGAWEFCLMLKENGMLAKPTQKHTIRLAPALIINQEQIEECLQIIEKVAAEF